MLPVLLLLLPLLPLLLPVLLLPVLLPPLLLLLVYFKCPIMTGHVYSYSCPMHLPKMPDLLREMPAPSRSSPLLTKDLQTSKGWYRRAVEDRLRVTVEIFEVLIFTSAKRSIRLQN